MRIYGCRHLHPFYRWRVAWKWEERRKKKCSALPHFFDETKINFDATPPRPARTFITFFPALIRPPQRRQGVIEAVTVTQVRAHLRNLVKNGKFPSIKERLWLGWVNYQNLSQTWLGLIVLTCRVPNLTKFMSGSGSNDDSTGTLCKYWVTRLWSNWNSLPGDSLHWELDSCLVSWSCLWQPWTGKKKR